MTLGSRSRSRLATAVAIVTLAQVVASLALIVAIVLADRTDMLDTFTYGGLILGATYVVVGWLIAWRRPENAIG